MYIRFLLLIMCLGIVFPVPAQAMSIAEAYKHGNYTRTPFDAAQSKIKSHADVQFLQKLFDVSDKVLVSRVLILNGIYTGRGANSVTYTLDMVALIDYLEAQEAPEHLQPVKEMMLELMNEQQIFMSRWAASTRDQQRFLEKRYDMQPEVQSSNRKVQQIYALLLKLYPGESEYNKRAFFDHLYALDMMN